MKTCAVIMSGTFFTEGDVLAVAKNKRIGEVWLRKEGFRRSSDKWNKDLFVKQINGVDWWARIDREDFIDLG